MTIYDRENKDIEAAVNAFWLGVHAAFKAAGHRFKKCSATAVHRLNGGDVKIELTDIKAKNTSRYRREWSGQLQVIVSDNRYRGQPAKVWRTRVAGWPFDTIVAEAVDCAARNKRREEAETVRESAKAATLADPRLKRLINRAGDLGGSLSVQDNGDVVFETLPMSLDGMVKLLASLPERAEATR